MKLTYIFHSGFALEAENCILVFDYWLDPSNVVDKFLRCGKALYVFASHFHEDHFNKEVLTWRRRHSNITYIFSKDIYKRRRASKEEADVWLAKGGVWSDENVSVIATGSNDSGVSWIVDVDGQRVFHAGDLNNWYARLLNERYELNKAILNEMGMSVDPMVEERVFLGELKDISKETKRFDLVMFPIDGRIGNGYTRGARQFIDIFEVKYFVPMHFVTSGYASAHRMKEYTDAKGIIFWSIGDVGEVLDIR